MYLCDLPEGGGLLVCASCDLFERDMMLLYMHHVTWQGGIYRPVYASCDLAEWDI